MFSKFRSSLASRASVRTNLHRRDSCRGGNPRLLVGEHPRTPLNILVADGSAPTALMGRTALLPLLLFLFHRLRPLNSQNLLHVSLVDGQLVPVFSDLVKLGIERFLLPQKLGEFRLQALDRRQLLKAGLVERFLGCSMEPDFFLMLRQEAFGVAGLFVGREDLPRMGIIDDMSFQCSRRA